METDELRQAHQKRETALSAFMKAKDEPTQKRHNVAASKYTSELLEGVIDKVDELDQRDAQVARAAAAREVAGIGGKESRFWLPTIREYRASLAEGADATGGYAVPQEQINAFYDLMRSKSVVLSAGPRIVDMTTNTARVPTIASTTSVAWYAENATLSSTEMTMGAVDLTATKIAAYSLLSNEVLADSTPSIRDMIAQDFAAAMALGVDVAFLEGDGTGASPTGMRNFASITETHAGAAGDSVVMNDLQDMIGRLEADNGNVDTMAIFCHPRTWSDIQKLLDDNGQYYWTPDVTAAARRRVFGVPVFVSSQISVIEEVGASGAVCSYIILADMNQVVVGRRTQIDLAYSSDVSFDTDSTAVRATARFDIQPTYPTAVEVLDGITAA